MSGGTRTEPTTRSTARRDLRPVSSAFSSLPPSVLVVGASTGGPQALTALLAGLRSAGATIPVCVTLHMPAELMPVIAAHVARSCDVETYVVAKPCPLRPGTVYFSPGNHNLSFRRGPNLAVELDLHRGIDRQVCQPTVDVMFEAAAACFGGRTLAVILSGMGKDGLAGARKIVAAGGRVLVQDKASSAVWGMPGAVVKADLATAALSPRGLADEIARRLGLGPRA